MQPAQPVSFPSFISETAAMGKKHSQLDVPGSVRLDTRRLPVCCPRCRKPLIADFDEIHVSPQNIRCPLCNFRMTPPPADVIEIESICPECGAKLFAARSGGTLEIDHIWCRECAAIRASERRRHPSHTDS